MDRPTTRTDADAPTTRIDLAEAEAYVPPSRKSVLDLALAALGAGPILITGDAGIGKSWLIERLVALIPTSRWACIDLTPSDGPTDLYRYLARALGMGLNDPGRPSRINIADALADRSHDGERFSLVVDEAHNLGPDLWEEVRVLANRLGHPDGFANLILVGQTTLVRRFSTRSLAAVEARLAAHLHVRPIDVAEAREWLTRKHPELDWSTDEVEAIHRDSGGNPSRLIRRSASSSARLAPKPAIAPRFESRASLPIPRESDLDDSDSSAMITVRPSGPTPLTGADRPPLLVEENAIEVGWSADDQEPSDFEEDDLVEPSGRGGLVVPSEQSDQAIHDHYAALQAWREWADNQDKQVSPPKSDRDLADAIDEAAEAEATESAEAVSTDRASVRVEGHQHFAPFGQLFNRMAQVREPGSPRS